jgi:hypothetical protein
MQVTGFKIWPQTGSYDLHDTEIKSLICENADSESVYNNGHLHLLLSKGFCSVQSVDLIHATGCGNWRIG